MPRLIGIALPILALPLLFAPTALADPGARLKVETQDIVLRTDAGIDHLALRILDRMQAICGTASDANLRVAMTGKGDDAYRTCVATLALTGNASAPVRDAFARALKRMR